jgi:hypothetical protein
VKVRGVKDVQTCIFSGFGDKGSRHVHMYKGCVLGDTSAGASVFWDSSLLKNIRHMKTPYRIRGIGGAVINVYMEGDSVFGPVGYHRQSGMNILSIGEILDRCVCSQV